MDKAGVADFVRFVKHDMGEFNWPRQLDSRRSKLL
jgi:hypothetical protein